MARYPVHSMSQSRIRCFGVKLRQGLSRRGVAGVATALTRQFYSRSYREETAAQMANAPQHARQPNLRRGKEGSRTEINDTLPFRCQPCHRHS